MSTGCVGLCNVFLLQFLKLQLDVLYCKVTCKLSQTDLNADLTDGNGTRVRKQSCISGLPKAFLSTGWVYSRMLLSVGCGILLDK
jgi:hypothetical protein